MSQDGSSSKSYIKHPTEKARLDNLAFTTFPEDYLPYTSPSYQRKAPYLVWDNHNYDGGGLFKSNRRRLRRCCCGATALASTIALLVAAILAIIAVSVYLGVVTNLFRSPILSVSGRFKVIEGDEFEEVLLNQTSHEFLAKAEHYRSLVESAFTSSSLAQAFVASRIVAFRSGSLLVFFRVHLDRRKLDEEDKEVIVAAKNVLRKQAIASPSPSFDNLILDLPTIDVQEYADEEWLMSSQFYLQPEQSIDSNSHNDNNFNSKTETSTGATEKSTISSSSESVSYSKVETTPKVTKSHLVTPQPSSVRTKVTKAPVSTNKGSGSIGYGYAEWKPIELPEAIQVASLENPSPPPKNEVRVSLSLPPNVRENSRVESNLPVVNKPSSNVASSIMSSVSLFIRPSSKNKTSEMGVGIVKTVPLDDDDDDDDDDVIPEFEKKGRSDDFTAALEHKYRMDTASLRLLELSDEDEVIPHETDTSSPSSVANSSPSVIKSEEDFPTNIEKDRTQNSDLSVESTPNVRDPLEGNSIKTTALNEDGHEHDSSFRTTTEFFPKTLLDQETPDKETLSSGRGDEELYDPEEFVSAIFNTTTPEELIPNTSVSDVYEETFTVTDLNNLVTTLESFDIRSTISEISLLPEEDEVAKGKDYDFPLEDSTLLSTLREVNETSLDTNLSEAEKYNDSDSVDYAADSSEIGEDNSDFSATDPVPGDTTKHYSTVEDTTTQLNTVVNRSGSIYDEDLQRFRKIVQPLKDTNFNPNDISNKDDMKDINFKDGQPPVVASPVDQKINDKNSESNLKHALYTSTTYADYNRSISACSDTEMACDNGECVPLDYRCNMRRDCDDNSDEDYCTCADYLNVIGQSQKICDGVRDCWDLSDEENCPWCSPGQFLCPQSKFCVNMTQVCDGLSDCPFGTDERYCVKLADDEERAKRLDYFSHGYLMVRKNGQWGKLCFDDFNGSMNPSVAQTKLDELGNAVCNALTYRELKEAVQLTDNKKYNQTYYEIKGHVDGQRSQQSSAMFQPSVCPSKDVVHVKCKSLECGMRPMAVSSRRRIVGGQSTGSGTWPWQVALYKEGDFQCGAVLVSENWLISAGHCFFSTQSAYWTARMGILRRGTELRSPSERIRRIVKIILHPEYIDKGFINDIALLKLERPIRFSDYLRPLCLPKETEDVKLWNGQYCSVVGWGKLYEIGHTFPDSLQEVRLPVISTEECRKRIIFLSMYHITDNMFCAGFPEGGRDACLGDSGGPLMCQRQDGRFVLLGVTSNGDGCGRPGRPGVYTKVTQYLPWIHRLMAEEEFDEGSNFNSTDACSGHRCELGRCVQHYKVCDGRYDCIDGSDEKDCTP